MLIDAADLYTYRSIQIKLCPSLFNNNYYYYYYYNYELHDTITS